MEVCSWLMSDMRIDDAIVRACSRAESILAITGAGMSADSGLPTYRGIGGLYEDAGTEDGVPIEVALSGSMLNRDPLVTWKHIARIEAACRGAGPNEGHRVLARWEKRVPRFAVLTQNVDGLHAAAGSSNVIEIHGDVHHLRCVDCPHRYVVADYASLTIPPSCERCGSLIRPDVVLFGEMLPSTAVARLERELVAGFDLVLSIGTTSVFPYIAGPVEIAASLGVPTIEINPGTTEVSHIVGHRLRASASAALVALDRAIEATAS